MVRGWDRREKVKLWMLCVNGKNDESVNGKNDESG